MKKVLLIPLVLAGLAVSGPARSQPPQPQAAEPTPPTIVLSHFRCDWPRIADILAQAEAQVPHLQEQKTAGRILDAGTYVHAWGDEWNVGRYIIAPNMESAVAANTAANEAFAAANPGMNAIGEACKTHRDNFYLGGARTQSTTGATGGSPTLVLTFFQCETARIGDVMAEYETAVIPVYQTLVNEGKLRSAASFAHSWADEWNVGFAVVAESIPAFLEAWEEANTRMPERSVIGEACPMHKDNFYTLGPRTGG